MTLRILVLAIALSVASTGAQAQVQVDMSKITCEQFAFSKIAPTRSLALWMSGYYQGRKDNPVLNVTAFQTNANRVESFCKQQKNLKMPLMQAIEQVLGPGS